MFDIGGDDETTSARRWRTVVEHIRDVVVIIDAEATPLYLNPAIEAITGLAAESLRLSDPLELVHPDDQAEIAHRLAELDATTALPDPVLVRVRHRVGGWRWLELTVANHLEDPDIAAMIVTGRDVSDRIHAEQDVKAQQERYRTLVELLPDPVVSFEVDGRVQLANDAAVAHLVELATVGGPADGVRGWLAPATELVLAVAADGATRRVEIATDAGDHVRWFEVTAVADTGPAHEVVGVTTLSHDVTEQRERAARLELEVLKDPLTGVAKRMGFELHVGRVLTELGPGEAAAVLYLDLDDFKLINDTYGHAVGDEYLRAVAGRLVEAVRPSDVVARLGGDEFGVVIVGSTFPEQVTALADRVHDRLAEIAVVIDGTSVGTASIGVAMIDRSTLVDESMRLADGAMYRAKGRGKRTTEVVSTTNREARPG